MARVAEPDLTPGGLVPASPPDDGEDAATGRRRLDAPRGDLARPQHQGHVDQQLSRGDLRDHRREVAHPGAPETQKALALGGGDKGLSADNMQQTWDAITGAAPRGVCFGWNFFVKDHPMLTPSQTMARAPQPTMISYQ